MRLEAPWTTARRLLSRDVAIQNAAVRPGLDVEALTDRINARIITFNERTRRRVNE